MRAPRLLATYLRDHHAAAVAGLDLARRAAGQNRAGEYGEPLARLADEIEADLRELEAVMESLGVEPDRAKDIAVRAGERLGRLKPNGRWRSYSPLSRLLELDGLVLMAGARLGVWRALRVELGDAVGGTDLTALEARAEGQRGRIEELRLRAAAEALGSD